MNNLSLCKYKRDISRMNEYKERARLSMRRRKKKEGRREVPER